MMDLKQLERILRQRCAEPSTPWGRPQSNDWDAATQFIYTTRDWEHLQQHLVGLPREMRGYAVNRWFNFWSARGVEAIFCALPGVVPFTAKDHLVDFTLHGIRFDHKTSVYPASFGYPLSYAQYYPGALVRWLYTHQSTDGRCHYGNRLFIVLYDLSPDQAHWKLRAELSALQRLIQHYVAIFDPQHVLRLTINGHEMLSDILWFIHSTL
jgi:hypothetical protein